MSTRHLLDLGDLSPSDITTLVQRSMEPVTPLLLGQSVAMVFEKPSARTRNSTEMAVVDLGGHPVMISDAEVGIDRRESAEDVARTLGCFHPIIAARVNDHQVLVRMAAALDRQGVGVHVVNLLSDVSHPCQAIADVLTVSDEFGGLPGIVGRTLTYVGDANNVTRSLAQAMLSVGVEVRVAAPEGYQFTDAQIDELNLFGSQHQVRVRRFDDPVAAATGADVLYTDVWTSMGQESESAQRRIDLARFVIDEALIDAASPDAIVLHCLPAHRGEEITEAALESPASRVWKQAAHRRTAMRGVFGWITGGAD